MVPNDESLTEEQKKNMVTSALPKSNCMIKNDVP
jgi:hypothetical protein